MNALINKNVMVLSKDECILGKDIDGDTVVEYLRNEFNIDIDELEMEVKI